MNNQKPFFIAGSILLGIIALSLVFMAGRMSGGNDNLGGRNGGMGMMGSRFEGRGGKVSMSQRGGKMMGNFEGREMSFIDESSLSDEQKTQLETIRDDQQQKMQDLMQSFRSGSGTLQTEIEASWKSHMAVIRPFVAPDQLDEFDAFVAEGKPQMPNLENKGRKMW